MAAPQRRYQNLAPEPWRLSCQPDPHGLACQLVNRTAQRYDEGYGLFIPYSGKRLLVLGRGPGVAVTWQVSTVDGDPDKTAVVTIAPAKVPVGADTWAEP